MREEERLVKITSGVGAGGRLKGPWSSQLLFQGSAEMMTRRQNHQKVGDHVAFVYCYAHTLNLVLSNYAQEAVQVIKTLSIRRS